MNPATTSLARVRGVEILHYSYDDGAPACVGFGPVGMTIDVDGSPRAYGPPGCPGLDYLANAGHAGNWWALACGSSGRPFVQAATDPAPGHYVSTTSYERPEFARQDPRRYLDSERERFIVVPAFLRRQIGPVVLGCKAEVTDRQNGTTLAAVVGDFGPATHLGEGSVALARGFGLAADPKTGGTDTPRFFYRFWPGIAAPGFVLQPA